jgi:hypothetical protein
MSQLLLPEEQSSNASPMETVHPMEKPAINAVVAAEK